GPCLSPPLTDRALTPVTRLRLGEPLPHQLPDRTQAHLKANKFFLRSKSMIDITRN
ncbi:uncharacterized protein METZ01_LOCUS404061, partial [marine metagenome]